MEQLEQFLSSKWFSIALNVLSCAAVIIIGRYLAKKQKNLADSTGSYQLRAYIPTIWTSLGILGTFVSIAFSLFIVTILGIDIDSLIRNIAPAFTTSIIGIIASIIASLDNKQYLALVEGDESKKLNQLLNKEIANNQESYSPEIIILEILKEIKNGQKQSERNTDKLSDELRELKNDTKALIVAHKTSSEGKFDKLVTIVEKESNSISDSIANALQKQKEDFEKTVSGLKSTFETKLSEQNGILENKLNTISANLRASIDSMNKGTVEIINRLVDALVRESEKRNYELKEFITNENQNIIEFIEEQKKLYNSIKQNLENIELDMRKLFEEDVKRTISQFAEQQHRLSSETITQCNTKLITDANDYLKNHIGAMSVYLSSLDNQTKAIYSSFINTVNGIAQTVENKLIELYDQQTDLIQETIRINKQSVGDALSENAQSIEAILKANKEAIRDASNEIKSDNDNIKTELASAQKRWKEEAVNAERDHLNEIKSIHTDAEKAIQEILAKITSYDSSVQQSVSSINSEITKSVQEYEKNMSEVKTFIVENHKGLQDDLTNQIHEAFQIKELEVACRKLTDGINSTINSLNKYTTEISGSLSSINTALEGSSKKYIDTVANSNDLLTYISETLLVDKHNITSVIAMLGEIDKLKKAANQIEENVKRIQSMQEGIKNNQTNPRKK